MQFLKDSYTYCCGGGGTQWAVGPTFWKNLITPCKMILSLWFRACLILGVAIYDTFLPLKPQRLSCRQVFPDISRCYISFVINKGPTK